MVNDGRTMRILLVEDDHRIASMIVEHMEAKGFLCDAVSTTDAALSLLRQTEYDVAILDHYLNGETTAYLTSHLRLRHPETKTITITGSPLFARGYGLDCLGTDFLFRKPFAVSDLVEVVKYLADTQTPYMSGPLELNRDIAV
jgi:two-component system response regulator BasR